jgi:DNA-binding transcriptional LysR family regulator
VLSLERMRVLHAVAGAGSVGGAAERLHVTTSAVSQQIAKLEREVGQRLLERHGRGVRLTEAAELLVGHAARLLSQVEQAEADLEAHRGSVTGGLTVAAIATAARALGPPALRLLAGRYPRLRVSLCELEPSESVPLVARGEIDVTVVQDWDTAPLTLPDGLARTGLLDDVVDLALPAGHPLAGRDRVEVGELATDDWVAWPAGSACHGWLLRTLRGRGIEPRVAHTAGEHTTQLALVAAGLGVALIPRLGRDPVPPGVRFVPVHPSPGRHVYAVWRSNAARRPAITATLRALRRAATTLIPTTQPDDPPDSPARPAAVG